MRHRLIAAAVLLFICVAPAAYAQSSVALVCPNGGLLSELYCILGWAPDGTIGFAYSGNVYHTPVTWGP